MKQPIITRDLERKAIYTDILYDPEWTYLEISRDGYAVHYLNLHDPVIVDWGDGVIDRETSHEYDENTPERVIVRLKGNIIRRD